jgi:hypothetical protein
MRLFYYDIRHLVSHHKSLPNLPAFIGYFKLFGQLAAPVDRSGVIRFPVQTTSVFPLPKMRAFTRSYEDVCDGRAWELLLRAERRDVALYVFWSGGVDSTCLLVSLLKNASPAQKERIVVVMSEGSIAEYPEFYLKHIRGKLRRESAVLFPYLLGTKNLIVNGELNDQLFGSDVLTQMANQFGYWVVHEPYNRNVFFEFFMQKMDGDEETARLHINLFEELCANAPIKLKTNFHVFWWFNFTMKWQTVYMRVLSFASERTVGALSKEYMETYYAAYYNTDAFQLWSMNNIDERVKDSFRSYKWPAKQLIYGFTKDADYRDNKLKRGSLLYLMMQHSPYNFIDEHYGFHRAIPSDEFYQEDNSFSESTSRMRLRASMC